MGLRQSSIALMAETLSPIRRMVSGPRPNKDKTALLDTLGKIRIFRQEPITGMNGNRIGDFGSSNNGGDMLR